MNSSQLKTLLLAMVPAFMPVLVTGAPGVGKTSIIQSVANVLNYDVIISHPVVSDPTDAKGLPFPSKDGLTANFLPYGDLARALAATRPTLWFVDDLGQAPPLVQASWMQLFLGRQIGEHKLPDCVTFVAASNRRKDRAGVSGILEPVKSRFHTIVNLEPTLDGWMDWALSAGVPAEITAFLRFRPEYLLVENPTPDLVNSANPRTWGNLGGVVGLNLPREIEAETYSGTIGPVIAAEFMSFLQVARDLPSPDSILLDPKSARIPTEISATYALLSALAYRANEDNFSRLSTYAKRLYDAGSGEFATKLIKDSARRNPKVQQTSAYIELVSGPIGAAFL